MQGIEPGTSHLVAQCLNKLHLYLYIFLLLTAINFRLLAYSKSFNKRTQWVTIPVLVRFPTRPIPNAERLAENVRCVIGSFTFRSICHISKYLASYTRRVRRNAYLSRIQWPWLFSNALPWQTNAALSTLRISAVSFCTCTFWASVSTNLGKVHPTTCHEGPEREQRCSSTLSLTSALDGGDYQRHAPAALPQGMTRYPLYRTLGGPQGRSGRMRKTSLPLGFDPRTVQPVASRYTDLSYSGTRTNLCTYVYMISLSVSQTIQILELYNDKWMKSGLQRKGRAYVTCVTIPIRKAAYMPYLNPQDGVLPTQGIYSVQVRKQDKMSNDWKPQSPNVSFTGGLNERCATPISGLLLLKIGHVARSKNTAWVPARVLRQMKGMNAKTHI
jgi:hypothetical protein